MINYCRKCGSFFVDDNAGRGEWGVPTCPECNSTEFGGLDEEEVCDLLESYRLTPKGLVKREFPLPSNGISFI